MTGEATTAEPKPSRVLPKLHIVVAYPEFALEAEWFRVYRRLRHMVASEGLQARLEFVPVGDIPPDADIVIAPETVSDKDAAVLAVLNTEVLRVPARGAAGVLKTLFERLRDEGHTFGPVDDRAVEAASPLGYVRHRGFRRLL